MMAVDHDRPPLARQLGDSRRDLRHRDVEVDDPAWGADDAPLSFVLFPDVEQDEWLPSSQFSLQIARSNGFDNHSTPTSADPLGPSLLGFSSCASRWSNRRVVVAGSA